MGQLLLAFGIVHRRLLVQQGGLAQQVAPLA